MNDTNDAFEDIGDTEGQPDGITNDSHDLPKPARAADRVEEFLRAYGDGIVYADEGDGLPPLYARDLEALRREHERANDLARQLDEARLRLDGAETARQANADHITDLYEALGWPADTDHDDAITKATELHAEVERQDDLITVLRSKLADACLRLDAVESPEPAPATDLRPADTRKEAGPQTPKAGVDYCGATHPECGECFLDVDEVEHAHGHESDTGRWPVTDSRAADTGKETDR